MQSVELTSTELIVIEWATFFGRYFRMTDSTETSFIPNMERRLATRRPLPEPGPPVEWSGGLQMEQVITRLIQWWEEPTKNDDDLRIWWRMELDITTNVHWYIRRGQYDGLPALGRCYALTNRDATLTTTHRYLHSCSTLFAKALLPWFSWSTCALF